MWSHCKPGSGLDQDRICCEGRVPASRTHCRTDSTLCGVNLCQESERDKRNVHVCVSTWKGKEKKWEFVHLPGHSFTRRGQRVNNIHMTFVYVCTATTPLCRMKNMLKECLPACIRLLIPPLCSCLRAVGGEKKALRQTWNVDLIYLIQEQTHSLGTPSFVHHLMFNEMLLLQSCSVAVIMRRSVSV